MRGLIHDALLAQRGALIGWVPVCLGTGIGLYFSLSEEPGFILLASLAIGVAVLVALWRLVAISVAPLVMAVILIIAGVGLAKWRTDTVSAPILTFRYYGPVEGRVVNIDRSASDAPRLTLDQVVLRDMSPQRTPDRVRVSVHGDQVLSAFQPGETLIMTAHLSPPPGPAEPGGFDFQRHAWFLQLGAVGYARTPVLRSAVPEQTSFAMKIFQIRMTISAAVQAAMPGETGAFAAAIMTGDRSAMGQDTLADLRAANLAHLLAISGLHMGLLTGVIFVSVRIGLVMVPRFGLVWPVKKIAAVCALVAGAFYLALSGGNVATERAYIMVGVMFVAVVLDRRALTLRAVAMAAIIVLVWQPEALVGPGFQMSFAATTALVAVFGWLRRFDMSGLPKWAKGVLSVFTSSFVAGLATAPFAAAHFNQIAHFGLIANLLSVPLMGILVMPAAVLAVCLAPLGLWGVGLWLMELGLRWILFVADRVANMEGAVGHVWAPHPAVLPMLAVGLLMVVLWQGRGRFAGVPVAVVALVIWQHSDRPDGLVADTGGLIGIMGSEGRALSRATGNGFAASIWLENDGGPVAQDRAALRPGVIVEGRRMAGGIGDWQILQVSGKTALADLHGCGGADVLISNQRVEQERPCHVFDIAALRKTGSLALSQTPDGDLQITTAHGLAGVRPWNAWQGTVAPHMRLRLSDKLGQATAAADQ